MRQSIMHNKKGDGWVFLVGLISLFFVGLVYIVMTQPFYQINDAINNSMSNADPTILARSQDSFSRINTVWNWWPIIVILGIILWVILNMIRRQPYQYYEGGQGGY